MRSNRNAASLEINPIFQNTAKTQSKRVCHDSGFIFGMNSVYRQVSNFRLLHVYISYSIALINALVFAELANGRSNGDYSDLKKVLLPFPLLGIINSCLNFYEHALIVKNNPFVRQKEILEKMNFDIKMIKNHETFLNFQKKQWVFFTRFILLGIFWLLTILSIVMLKEILWFNLFMILPIFVIGCIQNNMKLADWGVYTDFYEIEKIFLGFNLSQAWLVTVKITGLFNIDWGLVFIPFWLSLIFQFLNSFGDQREEGSAQYKHLMYSTLRVRPFGLIIFLIGCLMSVSEKSHHDLSRFFFIVPGIIIFLGGLYVANSRIVPLKKFNPNQQFLRRIVRDLDHQSKEFAKNNTGNKYKGRKDVNKLANDRENRILNLENGARETNLNSGGGLTYPEVSNEHLPNHNNINIEDEELQPQEQPFQSQKTLIKIGDNFFTDSPTPKQREEYRKKLFEEKGDDDLCIICFSEFNSIMYKPCSHAGVCGLCSKDLLSSKKECPICRGKIDTVIIYNKIGNSYKMIDQISP